MLRGSRAILCAAVLANCASARLSWLKSAAGGHDGTSSSGCSKPVKRAPVVFPEDLLMGGVTDPMPVMYSGYVNVTDRDYLFYWFAQAKAGAPEEAPLIVWSNGGPGCSAMEGMTTEHGPLVLFGVKEDEKLFSGKLSRNPYSWNNEAHVLYVDQPRYVGFSCGSGPFVTSSLDAGLDMVTFLRGWRVLFPEHAWRNIILAAESYGGHYVPAWSTAILDYNRHASDPLLLTGLAIGNGIVNETVQSSTFPAFARRQGLFPHDVPIPRSTWDARELMREFLGYLPNYYDYRLKEQDCCGCSSYNYKLWSEWLLRTEVTQALNICGDAGVKAFGGCAAGCIDMPSFDKDDLFSYSGALGRALEAGVHVTLYYGMQDTACNYVGGYDMASGLDWSGSKEFARTPLEDLIIAGVSTGKVKSSGGLTWIQVEGAGHMVPINNPAAASFAIGTLIRGSTAVASVASSGMPVLGRAFRTGPLQWWPRREGVDPQRVADCLMAFACGCLSILGLAVLRSCPQGASSASGPSSRGAAAPQNYLLGQGAVGGWYAPTPAGYSRADTDVDESGLQMPVLDADSTTG